jgi:hypothetical protein
MASPLKMVNQLIDSVDGFLDRAVENKYLLTTLKVFIALYAALAAPQLPGFILRMLNYTLVRVAIAFFIIIIAMKEPATALLAAVAFIITLQYADQQALWDTTLSESEPGSLSWLPSAKTPSMPEVSVSVEESNVPVVSSPSRTMMMSNGTDFPTQADMVPEVMPLEVQLTQSVNPPVEGYAGYGIPSAVADPQNNAVPGVNGTDSVQTWMNQHSAQGFSTNSPMGFDGNHLSSF